MQLWGIFAVSLVAAPVMLIVAVRDGTTEAWLGFALALVALAGAGAWLRSRRSTSSDETGTST